MCYHAQSSYKKSEPIFTERCGLLNVEHTVLTQIKKLKMGLCSSDKAKIEAQEEEICDLKLAILNAALEVAKRDKAIEGKSQNFDFRLELEIKY